MGTSKKLVHGIFWDYDGTLADTRIKNLNVTRKLVKDLSGKNYQDIPALSTIENYTEAIRSSRDWFELYKKHFGFNSELIDEAGKYWTEYQQNDTTLIDLFPGMSFVIQSFNHLPQAVVSMNAKDTITDNLERNGVLPYFKMIVGYEEVDIKRQKPKPDGLLYCIDQLSIPDSGVLIYIGDHETDMQCAYNANVKLEKSGRNLKVVSIAALYSDGQAPNGWQFQPDYTAYHVKDIAGIVNNFQVR